MATTVMLTGDALSSHPREQAMIVFRLSLITVATRAGKIMLFKFKHRSGIGFYKGCVVSVVRSTPVQLVLVRQGFNPHKLPVLPF